MSTEFVKELTGWKGAACLVRRGDEYFVVSSVDAMFTGPETLAFASDDKGEPTDWLEVAGGRGMTREETIAELNLLALPESWRPQPEPEPHATACEADADTPGALGAVGPDLIADL